MSGRESRFLRKYWKNERFQELYQKNKDFLCNYAYSILRDRYLAEDAVSEAFLALAKAFGKLNNMNDHDIRQYMLVITRHEAYRLYKKCKNEIPYEDVEGIRLSGEKYADDAERSATADELFEMMKSLKPIYGDVLFLKYKYSFSIKEISELMGISENAVKTRLSRGRDMLREMVEEEDYDKQKV